MLIAVDAMGGEGGPQRTVAAALQVLAEEADLSLVLLGDRGQINAQLESAGKLRERCQVVHAQTVIGDEELPRSVLRNGRESSIYKAVELVREGEVEAMVSAGNTGALLMVGRHLLKTLPGIHRPAIVATLPAVRQQCFLLDVGANPECDAQQLFEFAVMGSVLAESLNRDCARARVGLLNIGAEHYKGTNPVRQAANRLESCGDLNFIGFVEANELFEGVADVVVCDGFVGNVTIKSSAGVANVVKNMLSTELQHSLLTRLSGLSPASVVSRLASRINPQRFNGASLLGLKGSVVKSHGNATTEGFTYAIRQAQREASNRVPELIAARVAAIMASS